MAALAARLGRSGRTVVRLLARLDGRLGGPGA
jgi:hypothetical protein